MPHFNGSRGDCQYRKFGPRHSMETMVYLKTSLDFRMSNCSSGNRFPWAPLQASKDAGFWVRGNCSLGQRLDRVTTPANPLPAEQNINAVAPFSGKSEQCGWGVPPSACPALSRIAPWASGSRGADVPSVPWSGRRDQTQFPGFGARAQAARQAGMRRSDLAQVRCRLTRPAMRAAGSVSAGGGSDLSRAPTDPARPAPCGPASLRSLAAMRRDTVNLP